MSSETKPSKETLKQWHEDPAHWKWGAFYYNKKDKRLLPPKRNPKMGWTINFANPVSILLFVVILISVIYLTRLILTSINN